MKTYYRDCPDCGCRIEYPYYRLFWKARKNNSKCRPCFYKSMVGHIVTDSTRKKIGEANRISLLGNVPANKGVPATVEQRKKCSDAHVGLKASSITRKKHRSARLRRLIVLGIPSNRDVGAKEFFDDLNCSELVNFQPKRFIDIGYEADGYDPDLHVWVEFDPPHHFYVDGNLKPKDRVRQRNILEYFESIGNPLSEFVRVKADGNGTVEHVETIYRGER